ncbi:MAG: tetratricopeptide repeat protein [Kiritimatiellia bacterium]
MKRLIESYSLLVAASLASFFVSTARGQMDTERWFLWHEANARMAAAVTPEDFMRAAESYHQLVRMGVRNGPLFYNLGTALLLAQEHTTALDYLLRAERYLGSTPEVLQNLRLAAAGIEAKGGMGLPWYRPLFFWHFGLPAGLRAVVAACSFSLLWICLLVCTFKKCPSANFLLVLSLCLLMLFGSSALISWVQENRAEAALPVRSDVISPTGAKNLFASQRAGQESSNKQP